MKISVYGSSGFIGNNFCKLFPDNCIRIEKQQNKPESENILYFISTVDNYNIHTNPYLDIETNLIKLIQVLEECKKIGKDVVFNFISSWFVYGKTTSIPANENTICNPTGFYSITKHTAEKMLASYCDTFGIKYRILRLTNIIGPGDKKVSAKKNAIQYMIGCLKNNEPINIYDGGSNIRDFMDVKDCCRAIKLCLDAAPLNEIINISNSEPKTIGEIIDYAKQKLNSKSVITSIQAPEFHQVVQIKNIWLDNKKLLSYGYIPKTHVFKSIDKIIKEL
jgi:nucleoside-diphosphate-sugar epimerase